MDLKDSELDALMLDSSAVVSVILSEPGQERMVDRIASAQSVGMAAPTLLETVMVLSSKFGRDATSLINGFLREAEAEIIPFGPEHVDVAVDAFLRFGKGRHPAALNFGDCMSYAAAMVAGVPLLFTGSDFLKTDVNPAKA